MDYKQIPVEALELNPKNIRPLDNIDTLAESIAEHGLLQNLLVVPDPKTGKYLVKAGNRRLKAIQKLVAEGRWGEPVLCLVVDEEPWTEIVENVCRQQVPIWRLGARYSELAEAGYTAVNIAGRLGKTHGQISLAINIARGLHPDIIAILEKMAPETFTAHQLVRVSRIQNPQTFRPDFEAQKRELSRLLDSKPRGKRPDVVPERICVWNRYKKLKAGRVNYPAAAEPYIDAIIEYLSGASDRLSFNR